MYVKLMSEENCPDSDSRKAFRLLSNVIAVFFNRAPEAPEPSDIPRAYVTFDDKTTEEFDLYGNVYVMNDAGKTIEKFGVHPISPSEFPASDPGPQFGPRPAQKPVVP